jgi:hypothetical protein
MTPTRSLSLAPKALVEAKAVSPPAIRKPRRLRIRDINLPSQFEVAWIVTELSGVPGSQVGIREVPVEDLLAPSGDLPVVTC